MAGEGERNVHSPYISVFWLSGMDSLLLESAMFGLIQQTRNVVRGPTTHYDDLESHCYGLASWPRTHIHRRRPRLFRDLLVSTHSGCSPTLTAN